MLLPSYIPNKNPALSLSVKFFIVCQNCDVSMKSRRPFLIRKQYFYPAIKLIKTWFQGSHKVSPSQDNGCTVLKIKKDWVVHSHYSYSHHPKGHVLAATQVFPETQRSFNRKSWEVNFLNEDYVPLNRWPRSLKVTRQGQIGHYIIKCYTFLNQRMQQMY